MVKVAKEKTTKERPTKEKTTKEKSMNLHIASAVLYSKDSIVSKKILENSSGGITLFAFDKGQRLSEHTSPFDAVIQIIEGAGEIIIAQEKHNLLQGEMIIMPAKVPHAVNANKKFKMLLTMIKGK